MLQLKNTEQNKQGQFVPNLDCVASKNIKLGNMIGAICKAYRNWKVYKNKDIPPEIDTTPVTQDTATVNANCLTPGNHYPETRKEVQCPY